MLCARQYDLPLLYMEVAWATVELTESASRSKSVQNDQLSVCSRAIDSKMAWSKLETRQTQPSAGRSPSPHASQGVGRQDRDTAVVPSRALPLYRETAHRRGIGGFHSCARFSGGSPETLVCRRRHH